MTKPKATMETRRISEVERTPMFNSLMGLLI